MLSGSLDVNKAANWEKVPTICIGVQGTLYVRTTEEEVAVKLVLVAQFTCENGKTV